LQPHLTHQPSHRAASDRAAVHLDLLPLQLPPHLAHAVDLEVAVIDATDMQPKFRITLPQRRQLARVVAPRDLGVVRRRGDRQHIADRLDPVGVLVLVDEGDHVLDRRSSSACAKKLRWQSLLICGVR